MIKELVIKYEDIKDERLGAIYNKGKTLFRVYAPKVKEIYLLLTDDYNKVRKDKIEMKASKFGIFEVEIEGDLDNFYYSYLVDDKYEVTDPYSKASSINSKLSAVVDLKSTDPKGFRETIIPNNKENEAIIYELNVKDYTADISSGANYRGKFLGLSENDTTYNNVSTGLANLKELGITHVQLMPIYDFISTFEQDDRFFDDDNYNWGYDPELFFNVEGSYSINPNQVKSRIYELKYMINEIHKNGISVVMDVVFNHTYKTKDSNFQILAPGYYYRINEDGSYSNGSGVGNELASEKAFTRKLIIDCLKYWATEYKVDGFRFDLMALIDLETIKLAIRELRDINPNIIVYGEPWMALESSLDFEQQIWAGKQRSNGFAVFNDKFREAIKGDNDSYARGYVQGDFSLKKHIEEGMAGSINFDEERFGICDFASETVNYFNCHDNLIFYDKLLVSLNDKTYINDISKLAFSILFLSLGKPFIYEGNEFNNSKKNNRNSYNAPLSVNGVNWKLKEENLEIFNFVKELIKLRKDNKIFSMVNPLEIKEKMKFLDFLPDEMVGYQILDNNEYFIVIINASNQDKMILLENLIDFYGNKDFIDNKIEKIFDKRGKVNKTIVLEEINTIEKFSVNVYRMEKIYGL